MTPSADVLVIGAGMAGLKAAHDLHQAGLSVMVLEARARMGGRIHTARDFAPIPIELGAELIHTEGADTWELVRAARIPTLPQGDVGLWAGDRLIPESELEDDSAALSRMAAQVEATPPRPQETLAQYLGRLGWQESEIPLSLSLLELDSELYTRWGAVGALAFVSNYADSNYGATDSRIPGGYDSLINALAAGLDVRLEQVVTDIEWGQSGVTVRTAAGESFSAPRAVITLPPTVLARRNIRFVPDLPAEKWAAIDAFRPCDIIKIHLWFDAPVLPATLGSLYIQDDGALPPAFWRASEGHPDFTGEILVGWAAADAARKLIGMGESAAIECAVQTLRETLQQPDLTPRAARLTHWNDDPFTLGAYPYLPPGGENAISGLAQPLGGVLFWAGAATQPDFTSAHGAYASGARVSRELVGDKRKWSLGGLFGQR